MEQGNIKMEQDDDTIIIIVGDEGLKIKEEIIYETSTSTSQEPDPYEPMLIIKEEILDVSFENSNDEFIIEEKVEVENQYVIFYRYWSEQPKKKTAKAGKRKSFVKELCQKFPELAKNKTNLVGALVDIMKSIRPPPLPLDYYVVNGIMLECLVCSALTETIPAAGRHYQEKHGSRYLICFACGGDFRSTTTLYVHEKRCSAPDRDVMLRARAVMLGNKGKQRPYLALAKKFRHANSPGGKPKIMNKFACTVCPAEFAGKESFKAHMHLHEGIRPHKCKECDSAYTSRGALSRHVYRQHSDQQFICDHCQRVFKVKDSLVTHLETHRPRELRKFVCEECGRRFGQKHTMLRHVERKHLKTPAKYVCQLCPLKFIRTTLLKQHMKKEHGVLLMTQKMFYKALPTMTDEEVQNAKAYRF